MDVFISWSGGVSQAVALALRDWLPNVLQSVTPYVSSADIDKGARWSTEIATRLDNTDFGILCITADNVGAPWLLFEAGALSKSMSTSRVTPLLIGVTPADLTGPLAQFQAAQPSKDDITAMLITMNGATEKPLEERRVEQAVERWWAELSGAIETALTLPGVVESPRRDLHDMVEELLGIARSGQRDLRITGAQTYFESPGFPNGRDDPLVSSALNELVRASGLVPAMITSFDGRFIVFINGVPPAQRLRSTQEAVRAFAAVHGVNVELRVGSEPPPPD